MALRVLLADESATIKKIFQLALQDFGVEVTTVALGVDVVPVAQKFKPDIIFADVLLQKKSGYDVCKEVKADSQLAKTPVVLVWSGFMELDQAKYKDSRAEAHLEKPFDTNQLRKLIQELVPKTQSSPLAGYLSFPKLPDFDDGPKRMEKTLADHLPEVDLTPAAAAPVLNKKMPPPPPPDVDSLEYSVVQPMPASQPQAQPQSTWNMEHFEDMPLELPGEESPQDEFVAVELQAPTPPPPPLPTKKAKPVAEEEDENLWVQKSLANYKLKKEELEEREPSVVFKVPEEKMDVETFVTNKISAATLAKKAPAKKAPEPRVDDEGELELDLGESTTRSTPTPEPVPQFNERQLEAIIRAQSKDVIEKVVWQVVPEIATQIIERELKRLLQERDQKL